MQTQVPDGTITTARVPEGAPSLPSRISWGAVIAGAVVALAIALNYSLNDAQIVPNVVFTAAIFSVLVNDLFGARIIHGLLDEGNGEPQ